VIAVAGKLQKPTDHSGQYKKACALLSRDLGYKFTEVYDHWREIANHHEFEQRWPRPCAEWQAMRDVVACLSKPGERGS
jgi:hypothetical protein